MHDIDAKLAYGLRKQEDDDQEISLLETTNRLCKAHKMTFLAEEGKTFKFLNSNL
jgi:hypothetical protein